MRNEKGIVSIFVVIFAALLLTVITIGFIRIMVQEQQRATDSDLSSSAYDSAVAGVEDGKRVIRRCAEGDAAACNAIQNQECDTVSAGGVAQSIGGEVMVRSEGSTDVSLNQAYTCVKINMQTDDVTVNLYQDRSLVVPLKASGDFRSIRIRWMHRNSGDGTYVGGDASTLAVPTSPMDLTSLPPETGWNPDAASLLRVQAITPDTNTIRIADLDGNFVSTAFLRPANIVGGLFGPASTGQTVAIGGDRAAEETATVITRTSPVPCSQAEYQAQGYACLATLGVAAHNVPAGSNVAFLRLTSLYKDTSAKIELLNDSGDVVPFDGVQPIVDSTGRASNVYRRISSRVSLSMNTIDYPEYAVDVTGSLCKNYYVTVNSGMVGPNPPTCSPRP